MNVKINEEFDFKVNYTLTKKNLEELIQQTFSTFGFLYSSSLLDSLKFLGFQYATNAGISINIEDLKTPDIKKTFIENANEKIVKVNQKWEQGMVSDTERFQTIIDNWHVVTESLKNRIIDYYQNFDPTNNLYVMAFSGARGNMSQVRQLIGMRGLMSDQEGKIINLPIQTNFREGLSSIDYIISSYGARKGIVDTALKTADAGYLTRRLIYLTQDLVIREIDCNTEDGILILLKKKTNSKNLLGKSILSIKSLKFPYLKETLFLNNWEDNFLTESKIDDLKVKSPLLLNIRSSLTCLSNGSICQKCYGWDLSRQKLISLGEAVGIIAAQSIGEPGTQLTMRTFHTGGIFTGEILKEIDAPFSGKLFLPKSLKAVPFRTNHGVKVLKIEQEINLQLINWQGFEKEIFLDVGSYLYVLKSTFVHKNQLIAEYPTQSLSNSKAKLKPVYSLVSGKIIDNSSSLTVKKKSSLKKYSQKERVLLEPSLNWIASGKVFLLPKVAKYNFSSHLDKTLSIAKFKLTISYEGIVKLNEFNFSICGNQKEININLSFFKEFYRNCFIDIVPLVKNYQWVDLYTTFAYIYIFPKTEGKIHSIEKKIIKIKKGKKKYRWTYNFLVITENEMWKYYGTNLKKKILIRPKEQLNQVSFSKFSGLLKEKNGSENIYQQILPICLNEGSILNFSENDFVFEKEILAKLVNYTQQNEDIVQGLPKVEELIEARKTKISSVLCPRPGVILFYSIEKESDKLKPLLVGSTSKKSIFECHFPEKLFKKGEKKSSEKSKIKVLLGHNFDFEKEIIFKTYKDEAFKISFLKEEEELNENLVLHNYYLNKEKLKDKSKKKSKNKTKLSFLLKSKDWFETKEDVLSKFLKNLDNFFKKETKYESHLKFKNKKLKQLFFDLKNIEAETFSGQIATDYEFNDYLIKRNEGSEYIAFEHIQLPTTLYTLSSELGFLFEIEKYVDIGEPLTKGMIDMHDLLNLLFHYHSKRDGIIEGTIKSLNKFQLLLVHSIQSIYQGQGVNIASKHIEIIVRQMTGKVMIMEKASTPFLPGEYIRISLIIEISKALRENQGYKIPFYEPRLLSATNASLNKDGFISAAGFQETRRILTKAAIEGSSDWLRGLKESIIVGRLMPGGSTFLNYKNYLNNLYLFKKIKT